MTGWERQEGCHKSDFFSIRRHARASESILLCFLCSLPLKSLCMCRAGNSERKAFFFQTSLGSAIKALNVRYPIDLRVYCGSSLGISHFEHT